jgi:hypothetical protein
VHQVGYYPQALTYVIIKKNAKNSTISFFDDSQFYADFHFQVGRKAFENKKKKNNDKPVVSIPYKKKLLML